MDKTLLKNYARLVVKTGVNLQPGQLLVVNAPLECAEFARLIAAEYPRGKRIHDIGFHGDDLLSFFHGIYYIVSCP